jgi:hypothetical protein
MNVYPATAVLHIGSPMLVHNTMRRATRNEIDHTGAAFIHIVWLERFETYLLHGTNVIYLVDVASWDPVSQGMAARLVRLAKGQVSFIRLDMFSLPLPDPWTQSTSEDTKFLDFLPLVSMHTFTAPYTAHGPSSSYHTRAAPRNQLPAGIGTLV